MEELKQWFKERPVWLQEAGRLIIEKGQLKDEDYEKLYKYCLDQAKNQINLDINIFIDKLLKPATTSKIKLKSIENVTGINNLSTRKPLNFRDKKLLIIYGANGSGKSGYVRILKHISGTFPRSDLLSNIYSSNQQKGKCTIKYEKESELKEKKWCVSDKPIDDLSCIDIFDTECGVSYIEDENQITYEPKVLLFFSDLVRICEKISSKLQDEINKNPSKKSVCPSEYDTTEGSEWYKELSANTAIEDLNKYCSWTEDNKRELDELSKRLSETSPEQKAKVIRQRNTHIEELITATKNLLDSFSDENYKKITELKKKYEQAKQTSKLAADKIFKNSSLNGVGSDIWKELWLYAREYSEEIAYKGQAFPVVSDEALCVLCHQKLDEDAKNRLKSFESFIKEKTQKAEEESKKILDDAIKNLTSINIYTQKALSTKLDAAELQIDKTCLKKIYVELENRKKEFISSDIKPELNPLSSIKEWQKEAENLIIDRENKAKQYDEDALDNDKKHLLKKKQEIKVKEWLSQEVDSIKKEMERLEYIKTLESAKKLTNTTAISKYKSKLSEKLITQDFVNRFNTELKELKAEKIKVEIFKSRTEKGKALHQIRLKGISSQNTNIEPKNILSEGENRIVALSAFLADVIGNNSSAPFIFDDPISSLDQDFEEAVAKRLVKLSQERQVVVFTHRLSMLNLIEEYSKKSNIKSNTIFIKKEYWGTGEPGDIPLFVKKPKEALNNLIEIHLPQAKKILEQQGTQEYNIKADSLIKNFRIILENSIESVLIGDIVKRHRRQIYSQEVKKLSKIKEEDCELIDELMTKYSKLLHFQSEETLVQLPKPDELEKDFKELKSWIYEFNKR